MKSSKADRCEHCDEPLVHREVNVYRHRGERHVLFENVPTLVCESCGQRVFEADATEAMERQLLHPPDSPQKAELLILSV